MSRHDSRFGPARQAPRSICIVMLTGLGDVVHGLPVANALRRTWPAARIGWVTEPMPAGLLAPHPAIDHVFIYEKKKGWRGVRDLYRRMAQHRFDLAINLHPYFKSIWGTLFTRATERWTFGPDRARDGVWLAGNRTLPPRPRRHTQDMFLEFLEVLDIDPYPIEWKLVITEEERAAQRRFSDLLEGRPAVGIVVASANAKKDWPAERYVPVVDAIEHDLGARAVLLGGPAPREVAAARLIEERAARAPLWMLGDGVRRLIWLTEACAAVVAPDTGPLHIARAVGTPVVGLFGHTNPWRVGPYRTGQDLWIDAYTDADEAADVANREPKHERLERIRPEDVIASVERALRSPRPRPLTHADG